MIPKCRDNHGETSDAKKSLRHLSRCALVKRTARSGRKSRDNSEQEREDEKSPREICQSSGANEKECTDPEAKAKDPTKEHHDVSQYGHAVLPGSGLLAFGLSCLLQRVAEEFV